MDQLINDLCEKTGLDRAMAEKVAGYLKDNMSRLPGLLAGGGGEGAKGVLGGLAGKAASVMGR